MCKNYSVNVNILVVILALLLSGCNVELYSNLSERQANEMLSVLLSGGIDADKESLGKGQYAVLVPKADMAASVELLNARGLPSEQYADLKDMYKKEGLISSPMEERIRYMYSLSQSIAETLTNIDGVLVARVHVAVPKTDKFSGEIRPTSASVFIKYQEGFNLQGARPEIKRIVESSIEGLSYQKIAVYLSPSVIEKKIVPDNQLVKLGFLQIGQSSLYFFKWMLFMGVAILVVMSACIVWLYSKLDKKVGVREFIKSTLIPRVNKLLGKYREEIVTSKSG